MYAPPCSSPKYSYVCVNFFYKHYVISNYYLLFQNATSLVRKQFLNTKYVWSLFVLYIYGIYLTLRTRFNIYS